jgi:hypothetical protein
MNARTGLSNRTINIDDALYLSIPGYGMRTKSVPIVAMVPRMMVRIRVVAVIFIR